MPVIQPLCRVSSIRISNTSTDNSQRRWINKTNRNTLNNDPRHGCLGRNEMDTLADTSCAGKNWIPLLFSGTVVNVCGYNGKEADTSVPLATCATKVTTESGIPYILICPQMLYFGPKLDQSMIIQNQLRMSGTIVKDHQQPLHTFQNSRSHSLFRINCSHV